MNGCDVDEDEQVAELMCYEILDPEDGFETFTALALSLADMPSDYAPRSRWH